MDVELLFINDENMLCANSWNMAIPKFLKVVKVKYRGIKTLSKLKQRIHRDIAELYRHTKFFSLMNLLNWLNKYDLYAFQKVWVGVWQKQKVFDLRTKTGVLYALIFKLLIVCTEYCHWCMAIDTVFEGVYSSL